MTVKQAELVLSTKGLSVAQQQAVLAEAELLGVTGRLTTAELNAILVNRKRNKDQAEALLIKTGLITAETSEATATNVVTAAKLKELVQTKALTQAEADLIAAKAGITLANQKESASFLAGVGSKIKGLGTGLKSAGTGVLALAKAHPVIAGITTALTIGTVAVGIYKKKQEEAAHAIKEAYENAKTAIDEINSTFENTKSTTESIAKEYAELAQGVNLLTNENKKLSTEKYERFLELSNQLSELYPPLTKSFDENGNAILDLSGDVDTIVGSLDDLIERQRALANQEIVEQMPDLFAGYTNNVTNFKEQLDEAEKAKEAVQSAYDTISKYGIYTAFDINGNARDANGDPVALKLGQYISLLETLGITAKQVNLKDSIGQIIGYKLELEDGSDIPNISGIHDAYVSQFNKTIDNVKYAKMQLDSETSSINQYLNTWLQTEFAYNQLESDGLKKAIQETLFNFDWSSLPEGIDKNDWEAVSEYLRRNILFSINNIDNTDVSQALADIYTGSLTSGELLNAISKVQEYFGEEHPISVALEPKVNDVQPLVNSVKDLLKGTEFDDKVGELSLGDLQIASELEVPLDSIESWEELLALIQKVKDETFNNETTISFSYDKLENISEKLSEIENAYKTAKEALQSYNENGYYSMEAIDSILSLEDEYINILVDENGQLQLNNSSMNQLAAIKIETAKASIYQETCEELVRIKTLDTALAAQELALANGTLTESAYETAKALYEEVMAMGDAKASLANTVWDAATKKVKLLDNQLANLNSGTYNVAKSTASSSKSAADKVKEYVEAYIELQKQSLESGRIDYQNYSRDVEGFLKDMFDQGKISAKDYHDYTKQVLEEQKSIMDHALSAITNRLDKEINKYEELIDEVEKANDTLEEQKTSMENAAEAVVDYIDSLIDGENDAIDALNKANDGIQEQIEKYDSLINVADRLYEEEQERLKSEQDAIQDKIDLIQDENDAYDLQYRKEMALYELQRSQQQRTKKLYVGDKGYIYDTDKTAISEAKEKLQDIETEELISSLEKEKDALQNSIDALQKYRDALGEVSDSYEKIIDERNVIELLGEDYKNKILGVNIEDWTLLNDKYVSANDEMADNSKLIDSLNEKIKMWETEKEQWSSLTQSITDETNKQIATEFFGANWEQQINEGRFYAYNDFKNRYLGIQSQINDNTELINSYNEKIQYYESLKEQWNNIADERAKNEDRLYATQVLGADWESKILSGRIDTLNNFKTEYASIQEAITQCAWASAQSQVQAASYAASQTTGNGSNGGYTASNPNPSKKTPTGGGSVKVLYKYGTGTDNAKPGIHEVAEKGDELIIDNNDNVLLAHGRQLHKFEGGESVIKASDTLELLKQHSLTPVNNILDGLDKTKLLEKIPAITPNINIPKNTGYFVERNMGTTVSIGDIHLHEVQNVDGLAKAILRDLPGKVNQAMNRR